MKEKDYIPSNESGLLEWLINFSDQLPETGVELGITPAEISSLTALIRAVIEDIKGGRLEEKEIKKEAMIVSLTALVERMKKHPSYKAGQHGNKLGID